MSRFLIWVLVQALVFSTVSPLRAEAGLCDNADSICKAATDGSGASDGGEGIQQQIFDSLATAKPGCAADPECRACAYSTNDFFQVGSYCTAIQACTTAKQGQNTMAAVYTAAAAVCWGAFYYQQVANAASATVVGAPAAQATAQTWRGYCKVVNIGAIAAEMLNKKKVPDEAKGFFAKVDKNAQMVGGIVTMLRMAGMSAASLTSIFGAGAGAAAAGGSSAASTGTSQAQGLFLTATLLTAVAAAKMLSKKDINKYREENEKGVLGLCNDASTSIKKCIDGWKPSGKKVPVTTVASNEGSVKPSVAEFEFGSGTSDNYQSLAQSVGKIADDPLSKEISEWNPQAMAKFQELTNLKPTQLANKLSQGGVSSVLSGVPGMQSSVLDAIKAYEAELALNKTFGLSSVPESAYKSSGSSQKSAAATEATGWNMGSESAPAAGDSQMTFNRNIADQEDDIFHSQFKGSIFDIVTGRIKKNHDKVERLPYHSRMNKALSR